MEREKAKRDIVINLGIYIAVAIVLGRILDLLVGGVRISIGSGIHSLSSVLYILFCFAMTIFEIITIAKDKLLRLCNKSLIIMIGIAVVFICSTVDIITFATEYLKEDIIWQLVHGNMLYIVNRVLWYLMLYLAIFEAYCFIKLSKEIAKNESYPIHQNASPNNSNVTQDCAVNNMTQGIKSDLYECYCREVKKELKSPASAVFCSIDELQIDEAYGTYTVTGWVDSQNSYGAMLRESFKLEMKYEKGTMISKSNIHKIAAGKITKKWLAITIFSIVMTVLLFVISWLVISSL